MDSVSQEGWEPPAEVSALRAENARLRRELQKASEAAAVDWEKSSYGEATTSGRPSQSWLSLEEMETVDKEEAWVAELEARIDGLSASGAAQALSGNVSLEYTRDSPMFRRSCEAFEEACEGLDELLKEFSTRCRRWTAAQADADAEAKKVSEWLRDRRHARALFSGALKGLLGPATDATASLADAIDELVAGRGALAYAMEDVAARAEAFRVEEVGDVQGFRDLTWRCGEKYETSLCETLRNFSDAQKAAETQRLREQFETRRFSLVRHLNTLDIRKKLVVVELMGVAALRAIEEYHKQGARKALKRSRDSVHRFEVLLATAKRRADLDDRLWGKILDRLEAELRGELPPPGAPPGARAVAPPRELLAAAFDSSTRIRQDLFSAAPPPPTFGSADSPVSYATSSACSGTPRTDDPNDDPVASSSNNKTRPGFFSAAVNPQTPFAAAAAPPWSAALTTEVLSESSLAASRADLAHARDEGILKQGYLYRRDLDGLAGLVRGLSSARQRRKWHRLHNGALYVVGDRGDETKLCDLQGCAVHRGAGGRRGPRSGDFFNGSQENSSWTGDSTYSWMGAFSFAVVRPDGHRLAFQADNDDELIKWVAAVRRSTKWRDHARFTRRIVDGKTGSALDTYDELAADRAYAVDAPNAPAIAALVRANPECCECGKREVEWVATALGCLLCVDCSTIHRKLGASYSNLRALWLDKWSPIMLRYLLSSAGNERVNAVWEDSVPRGWRKPGPDAPLHEKEQWIVAKYVWFGFIGDVHPEDDRDRDLDLDPIDDDRRAQTKKNTTMTAALARRKLQLASDAGPGDYPLDSIQAANIDLATSAFYNDVQGLMRATARRASPTWRDPNNRNRSALHVASLAGNADAVAFLVLNGGDAHQLDDDNATPLSLASASDSPHSAVAVAQLILESEQGELW